MGNDGSKHVYSNYKHPLELSKFTLIEQFFVEPLGEIHELSTNDHQDKLFLKIIKIDKEIQVKDITTVHQKLELQHNNLLQMYGYNFSHKQHPEYIQTEVMFYVEPPAKTLQDELNYRKQAQNRFPALELLLYLKNCIDVLAFLEEKGCSHEYITSETIFFSFDNQIKLVNPTIVDLINLGESIRCQTDKENKIVHDLSRFMTSTEKSISNSVLTLGITFLASALLEEEDVLYQLYEVTDFEKIHAFNKTLKKHYPADFISILRHMLTHDESKRPSFIQLRNNLVEYMKPTHAEEEFPIGPVYAEEKNDYSDIYAAKNMPKRMITASFAQNNSIMSSKNPFGSSKIIQDYSFKEVERKKTLLDRIFCGICTSNVDEKTELVSIVNKKQASRQTEESSDKIKPPAHPMGNRADNTLIRSEAANEFSKFYNQSVIDHSLNNVLSKVPGIIEDEPDSPGDEQIQVKDVILVQDDDDDQKNSHLANSNKKSSHLVNSTKKSTHPLTDSNKKSFKMSPQPYGSFSNKRYGENNTGNSALKETSKFEASPNMTNTIERHTSPIKIFSPKAPQIQYNYQLQIPQQIFKVPQKIDTSPQKFVTSPGVTEREETKRDRVLTTANKEFTTPGVTYRDANTTTKRTYNNANNASINVHSLKKKKKKSLVKQIITQYKQNLAHKSQNQTHMSGLYSDIASQKHSRYLETQEKPFQRPSFVSYFDDNDIKKSFAYERPSHNVLSSQVLGEVEGNRPKKSLRATARETPSQTSGYLNRPTTKSYKHATSQSFSNNNNNNPSRRLKSQVYSNTSTPFKGSEKPRNTEGAYIVNNECPSCHTPFISINRSYQSVAVNEILASAEKEINISHYDEAYLLSGKKSLTNRTQYFSPPDPAFDQDYYPTKTPTKEY